MVPQKRRLGDMILTYTKEDGSNVTVRLKEIPRTPAVTIGRGKDAVLVIEDARASRVNTSILYWDDIFVIRDVHSSNGTFVNGEKIEVAKLNPGDVIKVGDTELHVETQASQTDVTMKG